MRPLVHPSRRLFQQSVRRVHRAALAGVAASIALGAAVAPAAAQPRDDAVYLEEPTAGLFLPAAPLAGEHDALTAVVNPAGLMMAEGTHAAVALDLADEDQATTPGPGLGFYLSTGLGGGLLPRLGLGLGLEFMRPSRIALDPDPGSPTRFTLSTAVGGPRAALGLAWHRYFDDDGLPTAGLSTYDLGLSMRVGARWAAGVVVRDLTAPDAGGTPISRRYEGELVSRPIVTDRLELAVGGRVGEGEGELDGWLRWSVRAARGLYIKGQVESRELLGRDVSTGDRFTDRDLRVSAGVEFSLGSVGATAYATGARLSGGGTRLLGGTIIARASAQQVPSVLGRRDHIERIELSGPIGPRTLTSIVLRLRAIGRDPSARAVFVQIDGASAGWATIREIREQLLALRARGKRVFAYMVTGSTRQYYLASAADKIYLDPAGGLRLSGFAGTILYFKGLFDKLGVSAQFEKIEEYKSAPEAFTRGGPTEPALRMRNELYDSLYETMIGEIATSRGLDRRTVEKLIDEGPYSAGDLAKNHPLIDAVALPEEVNKLVAQELGGLYPLGAPVWERPDRWQRPAIAIIYIDGDIVDGQSQTLPLPVPFLGRKLVGGDTIAASIAAARADGRVKAIVLRIDSPGGSALASEKMAREVFKTRGVKPIICSMGNVAASGGYYAAAGCDYIFADPMTITGSIGIFYGKFDLSGLMTRLGLSWNTFRRGERADMESYFRAYTDDERVVIKDKMRYLYDRFVGAVSEGRSLTKEQVDAVGRGRVWSGRAAKPIRLVDGLGGLVDAIAMAKARAGMSDDDRADVVSLPRVQRSLLGQLVGIPGLRGLLGDAGSAPELATPAATLSGALSPSGALALGLPGVSGLGGDLLGALPASLWVQPSTPQARLPFAILWH